jgi:hypothetical protein
MADIDEHKQESEDAESGEKKSCPLVRECMATWIGEVDVIEMRARLPPL